MDSSTGLLSPPESATSEPPPSPKQPQKTQTTGEYLEGLSKEILDVSLNLKEMNHPIMLKHLSSSFRSKHDALPKAATRQDHQESLQEHLATQPNFHVEILNSSSEVDDSRGRATVYLWYELSGVGKGFEREAVAVLSWERRQGLWQMIKHIGMRGPSGFS